MTTIASLLLAGVALGAERGKVELCHCPPGNPENCQTVIIGWRAAESHLRHHAEDRRGSCAVAGCLGFAGAALLPPDQLTPWPFGALPIGSMSYPGQFLFHPAHEPSGLVHVPTVDRLYMVGDESRLVPLSLDLTEDGAAELGVFLPAWDPEGITYNAEMDRLYVVSERRVSVSEYDYNPLLRHTDKTWDLQGIQPQGGDDGFEGIAYVPNAFLPPNLQSVSEAGLFVLGSQLMRMIYLVELDLDGGDDEPVRLRGMLHEPVLHVRFVGDLMFEEASGYLFVLGKNGRIAVYDLRVGLDPLFVIALPDADHGGTGREEGLAFDGSCNLYVADDMFDSFGYGQVRKYAPR